MPEAELVEPRIQVLAGGTVIFDPERVGERVDAQWFDPPYWSERNAIVDRPLGRGAALIVRAPFGRALLRHYRRGGLVARLFHDRYLWRGLERTRAFREFRLLARANGLGLPVPAPLAARIERSAGWYRADILLAAIEGTTTLAARAAHVDAAVPWAAIGQAIGAIHRAGIWHADLNAHNILIDGDEKVWIVDFDRAEFRAADGAWPAANLERLKRSLGKLGVARARREFERVEWPQLTTAHARAAPSGEIGQRRRQLRSANR